MPCNTNIHFINFKIGIAFSTVQQCLLNGLNGLVDIKYLPMLHTITIGTAKPENFQFAILIFLPAIAAILVVPMSRLTIIGASDSVFGTVTVTFVPWFIDMCFSCLFSSVPFNRNVLLLFCLLSLFFLSSISLLVACCVTHLYVLNLNHQ